MQELDDEAMMGFRQRWEGMIDYKEKVANNTVESVVGIGRSGEYELIVIGKGRCPSNMVAEVADRQAEHPELGPIGDVLASSGKGILSSVVLIQQHDVAHVEETPVSKILITHAI